MIGTAAAPSSFEAKSAALPVSVSPHQPAGAGGEAPYGTATKGVAPGVAAFGNKPAPNPLINQAADPERLEQEIQEAIEKLNEQLKASAREIGFSVDKRTEQLVVSVFNKETGELVRQIPAEAVIRLSESLESLRGLLFDREI